MFENLEVRCQTEQKKAEALRAKIVSGAKNPLNLYNQLEVHLDAMSSLPGLLSQVHPSQKVREEAERCEQQASQFITNLSLDRALYDRFAALKPHSLKSDSKRLLDKILQNFKRSGVNQDSATRAKIKVLEEQLTLIGQEFARNIREDKRSIEISHAHLKGLPSDFVASHPVQANGKVTISTDYPDSIPFMTYAEDANARKELYLQLNQRGYPKNVAILKQLIQKRYELAQLLGYPSFAEYVIEDKMMKTSQNASDFIHKISAIASMGAKKEYADLLAQKRQRDPSATEVYPYEKAYLEEKIRKARYQVDSQKVRSYFSFPKVRDGLLDLSAQLFELRFERVKQPEVWHPSVEVYQVSRGNRALGEIYLDLHPRDNKFKHAAQFTIQNGVKGKQLPIGALACNFSTDLMDHDQVVTFFHEFGHLMHHILGGNQPYIHFSGVSTEWDFVEAPSQFFEEWAWNPEVLQTFSQIPSDLVSKMRSADEFGKGIDTKRQMMLAELSLQYYWQHPESFEPMDTFSKLQAKYSDFAPMADTYMPMSFGHLVDYSAMYYTYMWSKVISKDFLSAFEANGLMDKQQAKRYRQLILEAGGSKDAAELVQDFLGRPYRFDAFQNWLEQGA
ncbi:MAG: Zn-dependent oligopeptidase [Myxococcaceae bacterium]|nr:Zn-dependent oligopeptidase [Myxococcaceae bacterium]MBH2006145.1 Zn-dependent oligopeptidase [Myxococcaceae bacterium]